MSEHDRDEDRDTLNPEFADDPGPGERAGGVWAQLRTEHAELSQDRKPLDLEVPGYSHLVIRYHYVPIGDTEQSAKKLGKIKAVTAQALYAAIDTLILACDEIFVRLPDGLTPLADPGEPPVRFDHRLAAGMEWKNGMEARQIVRKLFGGEQGDYQLIEQAQDVSAWMAGEREKLSEDFAEG